MSGGLKVVPATTSIFREDILKGKVCGSRTIVPGCLGIMISQIRVSFVLTPSISPLKRHNCDVKHYTNGIRYNLGSH